MCLSVIDDRWDFVGNTVVTNNYVRLTSDRQSQNGAIWNIVVYHFPASLLRSGFSLLILYHKEISRFYAIIAIGFTK